MTDEASAKVATIKIHVKNSPEAPVKPLVAFSSPSMEFDFPLVETEGYGRLLPSSSGTVISASGRILLRHICQDPPFPSLRHAVFTPLRWSSLWALSSQRNYDSLVNGPPFQRRTGRELVLPNQMDPYVHDDAVKIDDLSGIVYLCPSFGRDELRFLYTT